MAYGRAKWRPIFNMNENILKTSKGLNVDNNDFNQMDFLIRTNLLKLNTLKICKVEAVNEDNTLDVSNMIFQVDAFGKTLQPALLKSLPIMAIQGGTSGIQIVYHTGDIVICGFCDRDIQSVKRSKKQAAPATRALSPLTSGVVLGAVLFTNPIVKIKIDDKVYISGAVSADSLISANGGIDATSYKANGSAGITTTFTDAGGVTHNVKNGLVIS